MYELQINDKKYRILNNFNIKSSNNEVTFNDITIDFSNGEITDIPYKYQEIQILKDNTVVFTGFLDTIKFGTLNSTNPYREITLTLLSPLKLATKRCISLIGTYNLETVVRRLVQPLIDDGFTIEELNVPDSQMTTSFVIETIENAMNNVCAKRNLFWFIDENKKIYINSIDVLFGEPVVKEITENAEKGLLKLQPTISNIDYANVINIKNIRVFYKTYSILVDTIVDNADYPILNLPKLIKKGDVIPFNNPIVIDEDTAKMIINEETESPSGTYHDILYLVTGNATAYIRINYNTKEYQISSNITFSDSDGEEGTFVLQRDGFFPNLITGFKYNGANDTYIDQIYTNEALRYTMLRFMYSPEIDKLKGIISQSGQIEKTIDFNEQWITTNQLIDYARSLMQQNANYINEVVIQYDVNPNLKIGDIITINRPNFFIEGNFAVKAINYTYYNNLKQNWKITLKKSDFISSYIDLFRPVAKQESEDKIDTVILSEFTEEYIKESHEIELSEE